MFWKGRVVRRPTYLDRMRQRQTGRLPPNVIERRNPFMVAHWVDDGRTWHPGRHPLGKRPQPRILRSLSGKQGHRLRLTRYGNIRFESPANLLVCMRRKIRREVIHALGKAGSGQKRKKKAKRNENSGVVC